MVYNSQQWSKPRYPAEMNGGFEWGLRGIVELSLLKGFDKRCGQLREVIGEF